MKLWAVDGKDVEVGSARVRSIIYKESRAVSNFLRDTSANEVLLAGPKGFGKTVLLRTKRKMMERSAGYVLIPKDHLVDKPAASPPTFPRDSNALHEDEQYWRILWLIAITFAVLKFHKFKIDDLNCQSLRVIFDKEKVISPCDIFSQLMSLQYVEYLAAYEDLRKEITPSIRLIQGPVAVFIDNVDEFFEAAIASERGSTASKNVKNDYWYRAQLGLAAAAREINGINNHIKVYASIRQEVFQSKLGRDPLSLQMRGSTVSLRYDKNELLTIFGLTAALENSDNLSSPNAKDVIAKFVGSENMMFFNHQVGAFEDFRDFMLRHTLWRPRDLMAIGRRISDLHPRDRTVAKLHGVINEEASKLAQDYMNECRPHVSRLNQDVLYPLIDTNVLTRKRIEEISHIYDMRLNAINGTLEQENHPFSDMYRLGLLGYVRHSRDRQGNVQHFQLPGDTGLEDRDVLPLAEFYLIHPVLYDIINNYTHTMFRNLNRLNVIGKDMPWHTKADVGFVLRGDVVKYSEIMNNPDLSHIWDDEYQRIVRISSRDLMHFFVDSGDSVILIDKNWRKVVEAANKIIEGLSQSQFKREIRFGGDATPITVDRDEGGKINRVTGSALRIAARAEPVSNPGWIIVTDRFVTASECEAEFQWLTARDLPKARAAGEEFDLAKSSDEPSLRFKLAKVNSQDLHRSKRRRRGP